MMNSYAYIQNTKKDRKGGLAIWWMQQTHNLPKVSSILTTPIDGSPSFPYNTKVNKQENDTD